MKYLHSDPDIMGGDLVIAGTRIPVDVILYRLKDGLSINEVHELYPHVPLTRLKGSIGEAIELLTTTLHGKKTV